MGFNIFLWHFTKTMDFKDTAGTFCLQEYISLSIGHCFVRFMLLNKLLPVKCKMDYLVIKIFQVYERV